MTKSYFAAQIALSESDLELVRLAAEVMTQALKQFGTAVVNAFQPVMIEFHRAQASLTKAALDEARVVPDFPAQVGSFYVCEKCDLLFFDWERARHLGQTAVDGSRICPRCKTEFVRKFREGERHPQWPIDFVNYTTVEAVEVEHGPDGIVAHRVVTEDLPPLRPDAGECNCKSLLNGHENGCPMKR